MAKSEENIKWPILGGLLSSLFLKNAPELRYLHVKVEPKAPPLCPGVNQNFFFLKFGFNFPNFMTLGGCPLKNWTFVQKLVSYYTVLRIFISAFRPIIL